MLDNVWITRTSIKGTSLSPCAFESNWYKWGFSCGTSSKEPAFQCRRHKRCGFSPWVRKIPWRRAWQLTPVFLFRESHGQRSLAGYSTRVRKRVRHDWSNLARTHSAREASWREVWPQILKSLKCAEMRLSVMTVWRGRQIFSHQTQGKKKKGENYQNQTISSLWMEINQMQITNWEMLIPKEFAATLCKNNRSLQPPWPGWLPFHTQLGRLGASDLRGQERNGKPQAGCKLDLNGEWKVRAWGRPWWPSGEASPCQCRGHRFDLGQGRFYKLWGN